MTLIQAPRVLTVSSPAIPVVADKPALVPLKLEGLEGINSLFTYKLILQTPDALNFMGGEASNFDTTQWIGLELTCSIELEGQGSFAPGQPGGAAANQGAGVREISGLITAAQFIGESSRHGLYEVTLRPWLHLATLTTDCKVFQDKTPVEVIELVLSDYPFAAEKRLIETYPKRDYCVQYNETDFEFVSRLMQEWGINYHFAHSGGMHRLIWSDHNGAFQVTQQDQDNGVSAYHSIPFYPLGHKIDREYIHGFSVEEQITSGSYASREYDYTRPRASLDASHAAPRKTGHADHEVYLWRGDKTAGIGGAGGMGAVGGSDYSQPNKGADKAANQTEDQGRHLARLRMQALRQPGHRASGIGHVRGIVPGCTFTLTEHPREKANAEYIVLDTRFLVENVSEDAQRSGSAASGAAGGNGLMRGTAKSATAPGFATGLVGLPNVAPTQSAQGGLAPWGVGRFCGTPHEAHAPGGQVALSALSDAQRLTGQWRVQVSFAVQPTTEALRPVATQPKPKTGGPENALVVGPSGDTAESNIYTDKLGRIKVQFPWDRYGANNQNSSCWLRVSNTWAGNQLGAMHLPRIGQEVVVVFLGGDPDLPMANGRVYNQVNMPPWSLPDQQALSGFRSRELVPGGGNSAAGRSNHLILDDTDAKIQVQLKSDHQHSQLSLGFMTRIEDNAGRKDPRGEGFELRTDGHGVLRAKDGMLISTEARLSAQAHTKDMGETTARLSQAQDQHETLGDLAKQHLAHEAEDQATVARSIQAQNDAIQGGGDAVSDADGNFPELGAPHIVISSPAGIDATTSGSTHQHSTQHHAISSGAHTSISSAKSVLASAKDAVRMFAYQSGMKLISATSDVDVQALSTSIHLLAKMDITLTSNTITVTAQKQVLVNGAGSYMQWNAGGIEEGTNGNRTVHAGTHPVAGPDNKPVPPVVLPSGTPKELDPKTDLSFTLLRHAGDGKPVPNEPYVLYKDGAVFAKGVTDENGRGIIKDHKASVKAYDVELFNKAKYHLTVVDGYASLSQKIAAEGFRAAFDDEALRKQEYLQTQTGTVA